MKRAVLLMALLGGLAGCTSVDVHTEAPAVDYHQHLISPAFSPIVGFPPLDGAALLKRLDEGGVKRAVVLSMGYSFSDERKGLVDPARLTREENDWTSSQVVAAKGRLVGFCGVNPLRPEALDEIERCLKLPGMRGLKLHLGNSGVTLRNPAHLARMKEVVVLAERLDAPVLIHMRARGGENFGAPDAQLFLDNLVPAAPHTTFVIAHFGGSGPGYPEQADEVMGVFADAAERRDPRLRHLYFDVATILTAESTPQERARMTRRIRQVGPDRVLFGTDLGVPDAPSLAQTWSLFVTTLGLTPAEIRTIARNRTSFIG